MSPQWSSSFLDRNLESLLSGLTAIIPLNKVQEKIKQGSVTFHYQREKGKFSSLTQQTRPRLARFCTPELISCPPPHTYTKCITATPNTYISDFVPPTWKVLFPLPQESLNLSIQITSQPSQADLATHHLYPE